MIASTLSATTDVSASRYASVACGPTISTSPASAGRMPATALPSKPTIKPAEALNPKIAARRSALTTSESSGTVAVTVIMWQAPTTNCAASMIGRAGTAISTAQPVVYRLAPSRMALRGPSRSIASPIGRPAITPASRISVAKMPTVSLPYPRLTR
jgi:hypothetical protein